ncbi:MAG: hypothetical protein WCF23_01745, partial [Candidatus Nitrosopolaris sp.]
MNNSRLMISCSSNRYRILGRGRVSYAESSDNSQLINPKLLLDLPAISSSTIEENNNHNGGKVLIGSDNNI